MANSLNQVELIGNLGADPEVRYMPSGAAVANLTIATSEKWKDKTTGETKEQTEWHRVVVFGKLAEIAGEYLRKGSKVYIQGALKTRKWTDQAGVDRYTTEINVGINGKLIMLSPANDNTQGAQRQGQQQGAQQQQFSGAGQQQRPPAQSANNEPPMDFDDEIPF